MNVRCPDTSGKQQELMRQEVHGNVEQSPAVGQCLHQTGFKTLHGSLLMLYLSIAKSTSPRDLHRGKLGAANADRDHGSREEAESQC